MYAFPCRVICCLLLFSATAFAQADRPRTVVTTDGEIDDVDSFIRLLLYANEMQLEGLVYSSSMWHYKGDGKGTTRVSEMPMTRDMYGERESLRWPGEEWMQGLIADYAEVYPSLSTHAEGYPDPDSLLARVRVGNIDFEGEMDTDTEGSNLIRELLLDGDTTTLYLQAWGGTNTIARALKSIEDTYADTPEWNAIYARVVGKAVLYLIMDQDATYRNYVARQWPDLPVILNGRQFGGLAYNWQKAVPEPLQVWLEGDFMEERILHGHGPLTAAYYSYGDGQQQEGDPEHVHGDSTRLDSAQWGSFQPFDFVSEGDSPAFLHLIDVGLGSLIHPEWGGWAGRMVPSDSVPARYEDGAAVADYNPFSGRPDPLYPQTRWIPALQNDFAARASWCVMPYDSANHAPVVALEGAVERTVARRDKVKLRIQAEDPDGDALTYHWFQYGEADSYPGEAMIVFQDEWAIVTVPNDITPGQTLNFIIEVTDGGTPSITRYARVVLTAG